jgi:cytochrome P450
MQAFDPFTPMPAEARNAALAALRRRAPLARIPAGPWLAASMSAVLAGLKAVEHFAGSFGATGTGPEDEQVMAGVSEPRHGRIRRVFNGALAHHHASQAEPFARELAAERLEAALAASRAGGALRALVRRAARAPGPQRPRAHRHGRRAPEFAGYVDELIAARLAGAPRSDDVIARMLFQEIEGEKLSPRGVRTQTMFLIVAGNETTRNLMGNCAHRLARDPALYERLRREPARVPCADRGDAAPRFAAAAAGAYLPAAARARRCARRGRRARALPPRLRQPRRGLLRGRGELPPRAAERARARGPRRGRSRPPRRLPRAHGDARRARDAARAGREARARAGWDPNPVFWALGPRTLRLTLTPRA